MDYENAFNMDAFLNDLRSHVPSESIMMMAMLHHLWITHPLKLSTGVTLLALSSDLVFDASNVQYIRKDSEGDYIVSFKSNEALYVYANSVEYLALQTFIASLNKEEEDEH